MPLTRRVILAFATTFVFPRPVLSSGFAATVTKVSGAALARLPDGTDVAITAGLGLPEGTTVSTGDTLMELGLADGTRLHAGWNTAVALTTGPATGTSPVSEPSVSISGNAVVDRRGTGATAPLTVTSDGFEVLLAESRVFLDSLARPGVLVQDGTATVALGSEQIVLAAGEGIDIVVTDPQLRPKVGRWAPARVADAFASVGLGV